MRQNHETTLFYRTTFEIKKCLKFMNSYKIPTALKSEKLLFIKSKLR
jgi:hypothetical protein